MSNAFVKQLNDKSVRDAFVADQIRIRIALMIKALRDQPDRNWTQVELGERAGKPQNVISRLEDPDYGRITLQSLFDVSAAFDVPVWIDMPSWSDWLSKISDVPNSEFCRESFDLSSLLTVAAPKSETTAPGTAAASAIRSMLLDQTNTYSGSALTNISFAQANADQESILRVQSASMSSKQPKHTAFDLSAFKMKQNVAA